MGGCQSSDAGNPGERTITGEDVRSLSPPCGTILKAAMAEAANANLDVATNQRKGFSVFLRDHQGASTEQQLLVSTAGMAVLSSDVTTFQPWVEATDAAAHNPSALTCVLGESNINFSTTMLRLLFQLGAGISAFAESAGAASTATAAAAITPAHATTQGTSADASEVLASAMDHAQLVNVLRFTHAWGLMMATSAVDTVSHPVLGRVGLVQPLLATCVLRRLTRDSSATAILDYLLEKGANPNLSNSLGYTPLMCALLALGHHAEQEQTQGDNEDSYAQQGLTALEYAVRQLLAAGADVRAPLRPWHTSVIPTEGYAGSMLANMMTQLPGEAFKNGRAESLTVLQLLDVVESKVVEKHGGSLQPATARVFTNVRTMLQDAQDASSAGEGAAARGAAERTWQRPLLTKPVPWAHAIFNILWAVSQVMLGRTMRERREILISLQATAPFALPQLAAINVETLRDLGHIPRYMTRDSASQLHGAWQPTLASDLPPDCILVFVSHRWLGLGHPDNTRGDKLLQVIHLAERVAEARRVPTSRVYLWLDFAVIDQSDPIPGIQALPAYMACCHEFAYVWHEQYWERAWCLTEQFMRWKLMSMPAAVDAARATAAGSQPDALTGGAPDLAPSSHMYCLKPKQGMDTEAAMGAGRELFRQTSRREPTQAGDKDDQMAEAAALARVSRSRRYATGAGGAAGAAEVSAADIVVDAAANPLAGSWSLVLEAGDAQPPSPALGKLAVEGERVALSTMVSVLGGMGSSTGTRDEFDRFWGSG